MGRSGEYWSNNSVCVGANREIKDRVEFKYWGRNYSEVVPLSGCEDTGIGGGERGHDR